MRKRGLAPYFKIDTIGELCFSFFSDKWLLMCFAPGILSGVFCALPQLFWTDFVQSIMNETKYVLNPQIAEALENLAFLRDLQNPLTKAEYMKKVGIDIDDFDSHLFSVPVFTVKEDS